MAESETCVWFGVSFSSFSSPIVNKFVKAHVSQSVGDLIATVHTDLTDHELSCIKASKSFSSTTDTEGDEICCDPSMPSGAVYEMGMRYLYAVTAKLICAFVFTMFSQFGSNFFNTYLHSMLSLSLWEIVISSYLPASCA